MADKFRQRLKEAREARGLSKEELGRRAGVKACNISHWEAGRTCAMLHSAAAIAAALGVSLDWLTGLSDDWGLNSCKKD